MKKCDAFERGSAHREVFPTWIYSQAALIPKFNSIDGKINSLSNYCNNVTNVFKTSWPNIDNQKLSVNYNFREILSGKTEKFRNSVFPKMHAKYSWSSLSIRAEFMKPPMRFSFCTNKSTKWINIVCYRMSYGGSFNTLWWDARLLVIFQASFIRVRRVCVLETSVHLILLQLSFVQNVVCVRHVWLLSCS